MSAGWRTLDFSQAEGSLHYRRGNLLFVSKEKERMVPLAQVAVILIGTHVSVSGALLGKLSQLDTSVTVVDWKNIPIAAAQPWHDHSRIAARQIAQANLSEPRRKNAWARIVKSKVLGQAHTLSLLGFASASTRLITLARSIKSGDPQNIEGQAARIYWSSLNIADDFRRLPGAGEQGFNGVLDYAYTLLRGQGIRALSLAGLIGTLGFHHKNRCNPFALADDLIEPFRPAVEYFLLASLDTFDLDNKTCKQGIFSAFNSVFDSTGHSISSVQEDFAHDVGLYVEGETHFLPVPKWQMRIDDDKEFQG